MSAKGLKPCSDCSSLAGRILYSVDGKKLFQCNNCGLVRTLGLINVTYPHYHRDFDYLKFEIHFENIILKRYGIINKFIELGRVFKIGSSTGTFDSLDYEVKVKYYLALILKLCY